MAKTRRDSQSSNGPKIGRPPSDPENDQGERLREARESAGLTQEGLASLATQFLATQKNVHPRSVSQDSISKAEQGKLVLNYVAAGAIARVLSVSADWLAFGDPKQNKPKRK